MTMNRLERRLGLLLVLTLLLAGCDVNINIGTAPGTPTPPGPVPPATDTAVPAGPTLQAPSATPPAPSPTPLPPTAPADTTPEEPQPQRIQFASGATSATVTGSVEAYGDVLYVLRALAGQTMTVELASPAADVVLEIWGKDGQPLLRHVTGQTSWSGVLYATQDYFIKVVSFGSAVDYTLRVTIPPLGEPEPEPRRIQFASGATSATVTGAVEAYGEVLYVLRAQAGQTMTVDLDSLAADVLLEIWGADGTVLKRHVDGLTTWSGVLPYTQDYNILVVSFGSAANYALTVVIPP